MSYVGSITNKDAMAINTDYWPSAFNEAAFALPAYGDTTVNNPFAGIVPANRTRGPATIARRELFRQYPLFANITNNIQKGQNAGEQVVWENQFRGGWVVGGGVEYAFTNRIVGRVEYLYNNFGSVTLFNRDGNQADFQNEIHLLRVGATYRF